MNEGNLRQELDAFAVEFDPQDFLDRIFVTIQNAQSEGSLQPNTFFISAKDFTAGKKGESALNTFLRLLGFPATRDESELSQNNQKLANYFESIRLNPSQQDFNKQEIVNEKVSNFLSQYGTLNYFKNNALGGVALQVLEREQKLSEKKGERDCVRMLQSPLPLDNSLDGTPRRPSIFPLVVSADVPIFPSKKRTAPLFNDGDTIVDSVRLPRAFLEHVIFMRSKVFSGDTSPLSDALRNNITTLISDLPTPEGNEGEQLQNKLASNLDNFLLLELQLIDKFVKTLKKCSENYRSVLNKSEKLKTQVRFVPACKAAPQERSGESTISEEQKRIIIEETSEPGEEATNLQIRSVDRKINILQGQVTELDQFLKLLPLESIKKRDEIRRLGEEVSANNIIPDFFISEFAGLSSFERDAAQRRLNEAKQERANLIHQYEVVKKQLKYFTGELIGLSIFDVICVLFALFTVDLQYVFGLLNQSAIDRILQDDLFFSLSTPPASNQVTLSRAAEILLGEIPSPEESLTAIEEQVRQHFALAVSFFKAAEAGGENRK